MITVSSDDLFFEPEWMMDHHFFLSYARRDDQPLDDEESRGWVTRFRQTLAKRLGQLLGEEPRPWWDRRKIRGNDDIDAEIVKGLETAAAFVPVLSPSYLKSTWCRRELDGFARAVREQGLERLGNARRIFKVVKTPPAEALDQLPPPLQDLVGYHFFDDDPDTGRFRELHRGDDYLQRLDDLAQDLRALLEKLEATDHVYLAVTAEDVESWFSQVRRALKQGGIRVLPEGPLPVGGEELRRRIRGDLARCPISVHLLGREVGRVPEGEDVSLSALQDELAAEKARADAGFRRLIWMLPGLDPFDEADNAVDPQQRALLRHYYDDPDALHGADIVTGSVQELHHQVARRLAKSREERR